MYFQLMKTKGLAGEVSSSSWCAKFWRPWIIQNLNNSPSDSSLWTSWCNLASSKVYRLFGVFCSEVNLLEPSPSAEILTNCRKRSIHQITSLSSNGNSHTTHHILYVYQLSVYSMINRQDLTYASQIKIKLLNIFKRYHKIYLCHLI